PRSVRSTTTSSAPRSITCGEGMAWLLLPTCGSGGHGPWLKCEGQDSDQALDEHGLGHPLETGHVAAQHVVPRGTVALCGFFTAIVNTGHRVGQLRFGVFEGPRGALGVLSHLQHTGGHPSGVGGLARTEEHTGLAQYRECCRGGGHVRAL